MVPGVTVVFFFLPQKTVSHPHPTEELKINLSPLRHLDIRILNISKMEEKTINEKGMNFHLKESQGIPFSFPLPGVYVVTANYWFTSLKIEPPGAFLLLRISAILTPALHSVVGPRH